jgi:hypothetical protein
MKKLVVAILAMMVYNISMACQTTTVISPDGKVTVCTVCPNVVVCN